MLALMAASPALAADAVESFDPPPTSYAEPAPSGFDGAYAGVYGSYDLDKAHASTGPDVDGIDGLGVGGYAGYNVPLTDSTIVGVEAQAGVSSADNAHAGRNVERGLEGSLRGRAGAVFGDVLAYGAAGVAATKNHVSEPGGSDSRVHLGWTLGAGVEKKLLENVTGRVEYDYSSYGEREYDLGATRPDIDVSGHAVKLGVGVQF